MKSRLFIFLAILALALSACVSLAEDITPPPDHVAPTPRPTMEPIWPKDTPNAANGASIFAEKCTPCHGETGLGDGVDSAKLPNPAAPIGSAAIAVQASPADWYLAVTEGNLEALMPPFASLSDSERWDVVAYAYSLSISDEEIATGEKIFQSQCAECHGEDGQGGTSPTDFSDQSFMATRSAAALADIIINGNDYGMDAHNAELDDAEIFALTSYIRSFTFDLIPAEVVETNATPEVATEASAEETAETTPVAESTDEGQEQAETTSESDVEGLGTITGTVINGSTGGELPEGLIILLEAYDHDQVSGGFNQVFTLETALDADGSYLFKDVESPEGRAFLANIIKDDITYSSQPNFVTEGSTTLDLPIVYYETSTDASKLSIERLHIFFEPPNAELGIMQMVEVFVISNPTVFAIAPAEEGKAVIELDLPEGATNIQFEDGVFGERYTQTKDGFGDTAAILPGAGIHEIIVFFEMPYKRSLDFTQTINYSIDSAIVMSPQGLKIKSDFLQESGEREAQGLIYNTFSSQPLPIGATFEMEISGKVSSSATGADPSAEQNMIYGALALGIVLIGAGIWFYLRERNEDDDYEEEEIDDDDDAVEYNDADNLMDAIIALDDAYRSGDMEKEVYKKRRAALKAQLKELV
ncbi:MAG: c-type cytochrome [Anaerolineae bacterium]|jgi:mono/diheme cytochrome c family protein|nr:c-type cytochrome [Anaerolineae bacterium]MBT4310609.1 c-type cytochrome [Anaerolineae bacterium]MBT4459012.1 c-type cytochrome [Anaerolineae bacterium]MBT4842598.1 c-type cytochrome [Anaerolineae bacterium]MBT6061795.1 c-type cytochrome [Anaerolineae bacterium]